MPVEELPPVEVMLTNARAYAEREGARIAEAKAAALVEEPKDPKRSQARARTRPGTETRARLRAAAARREAARALANPEASNLSLMRHARNFSQVSLAAASGVPLKTLQDADEGRTRPSLRTRSRLARALDCSPEALL